MKASELRIGDWLFWRWGKRYCRVIAIYDESITCEEEGDGINLISGKFEDFNPVPLTNEMLLQNGFDKCPSCDWFWKAYFPFEIKRFSYRNPDAYEVAVGNGGVFMTLKYVHELQHLLYGIKQDELAKSFKIGANEI